MRKIKEILRLFFDLQLSKRKIANSTGVARPTVADYISRAKAAGLTWPLPADMDEATLETLLFPSANKNTQGPKCMPDFEKVHLELKEKGVTLQILWEEYKGVHQQDGYEYSQFCELYRQWKQTLRVSLRQEYKFGDKMFVDYAGKTVPIMDPETGQIRQAEVFVGVLGASNYTYAEAFESQSLPNWISAHVNAFGYFGGTPRIITPDNLKSGVVKPCRYEPDINPTYLDMANHYGCVIIPARVRKPKDKPKAEAAVRVVTMWIIAALRKHTFFSLAELNGEIRRLLEILNAKDMKKLKTTRKELFLNEKQFLRPLPAERYEFAEWIKTVVNFDYHVEVADHYYSVPYTYIKKEIEVRLTLRTVEFIYKGRRIASHERSNEKGKMTTLPEHRPMSHQMVLGWTPSSVLDHARNNIGSSAVSVFEKLLGEVSHQEKGTKSCIGIISLVNKFSAARVEAACERSLVINSVSYKSIRSILQTGRDKIALSVQQGEVAAVAHENIRGSGYFK